MHIIFSKKFRKRHRQLSLELQNRFRGRLILYLQNKNHPALNVHPLKGVFLGHYSLNVSGDIRAIFEIREHGNSILFHDIGSYSQLYS
jgi:mRNA-degrading endonuclease YafQ of YafQ-DinJ toxin-antitoxin module